MVKVIRKTPIVVVIAVAIAAVGTIPRRSEGGEIDRLSIEGHRLLDRGDYVQALAVFDRILKLFPLNINARIDLALTLLCMGRFDDALIEYDKALFVDSKNIVSLLGKSQAFLSIYEYDLSLPWLEKTLAIDPGCHVAYQKSAWARLGLNQDERALEDLNQAIALAEREPANVRSGYLLSRASVEMRLNRTPIAEKDVDAAIELAPEGYAGYATRGELLDRLGRHEDATNDYKTALRLGPKIEAVAPSYNGPRIKLVTIAGVRGRSSSLSAMGFCNERLGNPSAAIKFFDMAIAIDPRNASAYVARAFARFTRGDLKGARDDVVAAHELDQHDANSSLLRAAIDAIEKPGESIYAARAYIDLRSWSDPESTTAAIIGAIGAIRAEHREDADPLLDEAGKPLQETDWPKPILKYLKREIDEQKLIEVAATPDQKSEAHAYLAVNLSIAGKHADAAEHLKRLVENGNKRSLSYDLAINEFRRADPESIAKLFPAPPADAPRTKAAVKTSKRKTRPTPTRKKPGNSR